MRQAVSGDAMGFAVANRCVVDHGIDAAERLDLRRDVLGSSYGLDIADRDRLCLWQLQASLVSSLGIPGVQHDAVALACEHLGRHQAKSGGRSRDEDARHGRLHSLSSNYTRCESLVRL